MDVEDKQRVWIWEYFLKNCTDARMIRELMVGFPIPNENLDLKKMLLLRALSLQLSAGLFDELTLYILRGLGVLMKVSEATKSSLADCSIPASARKRKLPDDMRKNEVSFTISALNSSPSQAKGVDTVSSNIETRKDTSKDDRKAQAVVGIRDWMKGRALPRTVVGSGNGEEQIKEKNNEGTTSCLQDLVGGEFHFTVGHSSKQWEVELAMMVELVVKHLRGDSPDKASFEQAFSKYWSDLSDDPEVCPAADGSDFRRAMDQIKGELHMVTSKPELLDSIVERYPKDRLEDMLKIYLDKAWAETGPTFLERLGADVVNGKYNPVNCNNQRQPRKVAMSSEDGESGREGTGKDQTVGKPWIRATRGKYSRSREKQQKSFAIWDLDDSEGVGLTAKQLPMNEDDREGGEANAKATGGGNKDLDNVTVRQTGRAGGRTRARGSPSSEKQLGIDINNTRARSFGNSVIDDGVARVLEFEEPSLDGTADGIEKQNGNSEAAELNAELMPIESGVQKAADPINLSQDGQLSGNPKECGPTDLAVGDTAIPRGAFDAAGGPLTEEGEATRIANDKRDKEASNTKCLDDMAAVELRSAPLEEAADKENVVPVAASPLQHLETSQNPSCFNLPPWVAGSPAGLVTTETSGLIIGDASTTAAGQEGVPTRTEVDNENQTKKSADAVLTQRTLRRKKGGMTGAVEQTSTLPTIVTTAEASSSLLERNPTAHTLEWDEDDDIEETQPSSPSASRRVHSIRGHVSPLIGGMQSKPVDGNNVAAGQGRRKRRRWSETEVGILKAEVNKYGKGRWKLILEKNLETFQGRTEVDLKDKWRNLERFEGITE